MKAIIVTEIDAMVKKEYHLDEVRLMATLPGALKRKLRKGDLVFADAKKKHELEKILLNAGVGFAVFNHAYHIVMVVVQ